MARSTLADVFNRARQYLDTDELNFPNALLNNLLRRIWFQAVAMEREWRFLQKSGTAPVVAGDAMVPFDFTPYGVGTVPTPGTRILSVGWNNVWLAWTEYTHGQRAYGAQQGVPGVWSEMNDGPQRNIRLFPAPSMDGTLTVDWYLEPTYPPGETDTFAELPEEFDDALVEGLLAEMYMREEDPDLYDVHRQMFLEQMGAIRNRWRYSVSTPLVMGGRARLLDPGGSSAPAPGFTAGGSYKLPVAPG